MGNTYSRSSGNVSTPETEKLATPPIRFLDLPLELRLAVYPQILFTDEPLHWIGPNTTPDNMMSSSLAGSLSELLGVRKPRPAATTRNAVSSHGTTITTTTTTALLFTCKKIYCETIEIFYRNNIFVIRAMTFGFQPNLRYQPRLLLIQHLWIQFEGTYERSALSPDDFLDLVDTTTSSCLADITENCPKLKGLTIRDVPDAEHVADVARHSRPDFTAKTDDYLPSTCCNM